MSACLRGDVNEAILTDKYAHAKQLANEYVDIFGKGNFFLEMQEHGLDQDKIAMPAIRRMSAETAAFRWSSRTTPII